MPRLMSSRRTGTGKGGGREGGWVGWEAVRREKREGNTDAGGKGALGFRQGQGGGGWGSVLSLCMAVVV